MTKYKWACDLCGAFLKVRYAEPISYTDLQKMVAQIHQRCSPSKLEGPRPIFLIAQGNE